MIIWKERTILDKEIVVTEKVAKFIEWANSLGEDEVRKRVREKIDEIRDIPKNTRDRDGFFWDDRLVPNDKNDQYKNGGDCNLCKRKSYCGTQCGANKVLKKITTPYLYQMYLDENPEVAAEEAAGNAKKMTPDDVLKMVGAHDGQQLLF